MKKFLIILCLCITLLAACSFAASAAFTYVPYLNKIDEGIRIIILTVVISLLAAIFFPIKSEADRKECE